FLPSSIYSPRAGCPPAPTESTSTAKRAGRPDLAYCSSEPAAHPSPAGKTTTRGRMLEGKARVEDTDMPARMQAAATSAASRALDLFDVADCRAIAGHIKTEFDKRYGVGWQCVVGANFGCFFTHTSGTFIYFSLERLSFLLFKAAAVAAA
ncbi:unnamed protein product, partial [Urochloa humidicola]